MDDLPPLTATDLVDRDVYVEVVCTYLHGLVRADLVAWNAIDLGNRSVEVLGHPTSRLPADTAARILAANDHPMVRSFVDDVGRPGIAPPRLLSGLVTRSQLRSTSAWSTVVHPTWAEHQVAVPVTPVTEAGGRAWVVNRRHGDFDPDDLALLTRVQPLLVLLDRAYGANPVALSRRIDPTVSARYGLTDREVEVLELVLLGLTSHVVGRRLGISGRTVDKHLQSAYAKLGVTNRVSAITALTALAGAAAATSP